MAILDQNQIFFTPFEPKQSNRFVATIDGVPAYLVKGVSAVNLTQTAVALNHINIQRYVKAVMEWVRLGHESVTGRDGYSDFYKKDITFNVIGPVGDIVSEWIVKGAVITSVNFGDYSYDDDGTPVNITVEVQPDYCVLNY